MIAMIAQMLGKTLIAMVMKLATQKFFSEILIMIAEKAAESTATEFDDELVKKIKEALEVK